MGNRTGEMLESIERIIKEHEESLATYDDSYNIFDVLGLSTGETKMCRFLADLLNPHGAHKRGDKYLRSFLEVLKATETLENQTKVVIFNCLKLLSTTLSKTLINMELDSLKKKINNNILKEKIIGSIKK